MEESQASLVDLQDDILKEILIRVSRSSNGAKDFAKAMSVCKAFRQFVEDRDVLRAVVFDGLVISDRWELFQLTGGLICRCAQAGKDQAQFILGKIILVSASQLFIANKPAQDKEKALSSAHAKEGSLPKETAQVSSFLDNFLLDMCPHFIGQHFDFVKIFLARARRSEFVEMQRYLTLYVSYFLWCRKRDHEQLAAFATQFLDFFRIVCSFEEQLEPKTLEFSNMAKEFCLVSLRALPLLGLKKEQLARINLGLEDIQEVYGDRVRASRTTTLVAELDMLLKRLRAVEAVIQGVEKVSQDSAQKNAELAHVFLLLPASEQVRDAISRVQELKAQASIYNEMRTNLILKFGDFFSLSTC